MKAPNVIPVMFTKEDLLGNYCDNYGCPLYKALIRLGYPVIAVGGSSVDIFGDDDYLILEELGADLSPIREAIRTKTPTLIHLLKL